MTSFQNDELMTRTMLNWLMNTTVKLILIIQWKPTVKKGRRQVQFHTDLQARRDFNSRFQLHISLLLTIVVFCVSIADCTTGFAEKNTSGANATTNTLPIQFDKSGWQWWRGNQRNGIANSDQNPPTSWSESSNVLWKAKVPGRGHGSPTLFEDQVFLATAEPDQERQSVICWNRHTGKQLWKSVIHSGPFMNASNNKKANKKATFASSSVACDGKRLFINFLHQGAVYTTALDRNGKQLWQQKVSDYVIHQGYGASPALYQSLVIVIADNKGGGLIAAMDRSTGKFVWQRKRPKTPNYSSPIILKVAGKDQLLLTGCDLVTSLNPLTGEVYWEIKGATTECVTSTVTDGTLIITSGGYPDNHVSAVKADGSGQVVWRNNSRVYVPSLLIHEDYLYGVMDAGVAICWKVSNGKEIWKGRLKGTFSSSPVLVRDRIYVTNEAGTTFIFKATPNQFQLLNSNQLGNEIFSTPAIADSKIYQRIAVRKNGKRQEYLVCIGENDE